MATVDRTGRRVAPMRLPSYLDSTVAAQWRPSLPVQVRHTLGGSPYCVPAALSALTGLNTLETTKLLQEEIGNKPIAGVFYPIALKILGQLGFKYQEWGFFEREGLYLVRLRGHMGVVSTFSTPSTYSTPSTHPTLQFFDNSNPTGTNQGTPGKRRIEKIFRVWKED